MTIRVPVDLDRRIAREARRQSLLVSGRDSEREALEFIDASADQQGWR